MPNDGAPPPHFETQSEVLLRHRVDRHERELGELRAGQASLAGVDARQGELLAQIWEGMQMLLKETGAGMISAIPAEKYAAAIAALQADMG